MKRTPYGKIVTLKDQATGVECWNFTDHSTHTLPAGTLLELEHVHASDTTTCMLVDADGGHPGIMLKTSDGKDQRGYRFILKNEQLNQLADAGLPATTYDMIGAIIAYEAGELTKEATVELFNCLGKTVNSLQGHYGRAAANFRHLA